MCAFTKEMAFFSNECLTKKKEKPLSCNDEIT
jgi:hypothetical protein